ncbi:MAG: UDP-2,3-diacylglucosamine diphosphatase LpxI [Pseudomonadota bacterium]
MARPDLPKLAVLAGNGPLPRQVAEAARDQGREVIVITIEDVSEEADFTPEFDHARVRLGGAKQLIKTLKQAKAQQVIMVGGARRPGLRELKPDMKALSIITKATLKGLGDDGLLGAVCQTLEDEGFQVIGATDILPDLLAPMGRIAGPKPDDQAERDIRRGVEVVTRLGEADVGQGAVVQQGIVLAVEAIEGTDAMIARTTSLRREGAGGVLVKLAKPQQDHRVDLPTIGLKTVEAAAAAGLRGIAVSAGACQIVDTDAVKQAAQDADLFLLGITADYYLKGS